MMERTPSSLQIVAEEELAKVNKFKQSLSAEDRIIFTDLLDQCKLSTSAARPLASPVNKFPLLFLMLFVHHKKLIELENRMKE